MAAEKARDGRITNLRALAIIIVVLGHSIILYQDSWTLYTPAQPCAVLNALKNCIDLIQMPLFFSLSGYLFLSGYKKYGFGELLKKKAVRLLVPLAVFSLLWVLPVRLLVGYADYQGRSLADVILRCFVLGADNGHLWYLQCLYVCFAAAWLALRLTDALKLKAAGDAVHFAAAIIMSRYICGMIPARAETAILRTFYTNYVWFLAGFMLHRYVKYVGKLRKYSYALLLPLLLLLLRPAFGAFRYVLAAKLLALCLIHIIMTDKTCPTSEYVSANSFGLYLLHSPLVYLTYTAIPNAHPLIVVGINFIVFGGLSLLLSARLAKSKLKFIIGG